MNPLPQPAADDDDKPARFEIVPELRRRETLRVALQLLAIVAGIKLLGTLLDWLLPGDGPPGAKVIAPLIMAMVLFYLWRRSLRWGTALVFENDRLVLLRGGEQVEEVDREGLERVTMDRYYMVLGFKRYGFPQKTIIARAGFSPEAWRALRERMARFAGDKLRQPPARRELFARRAREAAQADGTYRT